MSSDPCESSKRPNEECQQEKEFTDGSSPLKKFRGIGPNEHAKPKRRGRRGKKRKQRKSSNSGGAACGGEHHEECNVDHPAECEKHCMSWDSDEEDIEVEDFNLFGDVLIRPTNVPKAPENSTQFIIDDHDECRLYKSFETPNPYLPDFLRPEKDNSEIIEPEGEDAAYVDINYEYESPHDFDNSAYYDKEFELSYKNNRYDELLRLSREELISGLRNLQDHIQELNEELVKEDPDPILERLQTELLEQQEKHSQLKEENSRLQKRLEEAGIDYRLLEENIASEKHHLVDHLVETSDLLVDASEQTNVENQCLEDSMQNVSQEQLENDSTYEPVLQCSEESLSKQSTQSPLSVYNQKDNSESPCHIPCMDASNKENACYDELTFEERLQSAKCTPRHESCNDSCSEHIPVKGILRDSEFNETQCCEDVSDEHEMNAVTV
ncbi:DNA ligase 1 [Parasteatoda tepidariorum]|uniref:DNA ligase 1 n=1 Tax=Parasteatoda tepidariorum TaxID=114398 RepID=UPI00077FC544|nr:uncharacterized protein LOC107436101 [Parasteatoda tepidariorum]